MAIHTLTIPKWLPVRLNTVLGRHWRASHRAKQETEALLRVYAHNAGVPKATTRRRVTLLLTLGPRNNQCDRDAVDKCLLDAMTRCGLILDDSDAGLAGRVEVFFARGRERATTITLEDIEP